MSYTDDEHLDVCQNIEFGLKEQYEQHPELTDNKCIFGLENAKIAIKQKFGYAQNESVTDMEEVQGVIAWCITIGLERIEKVNNLTLKEYTSRIEKILRSVRRHSNYGSRGYYEFIRHYV